MRDEFLMTHFGAMTKEQLIEERKKRREAILKAVQIEDMAQLLAELDVIQVLLASDENE